MELKRFFENNKAVSPVIGVVLMVAITVILAAAIGSSVFGEGTSEPAPQAHIGIEAFNGSVVKIEHLGGDSINFASNSTTKVVANDGKTSYMIDATEMGTFEVGDTKNLKLKNETDTTDEITFDSGKTVNFKIIDVATSQLIVDKDIRF